MKAMIFLASAAFFSAGSVLADASSSDDIRTREEYQWLFRNVEPLRVTEHANPQAEMPPLRAGSASVAVPPRKFSPCPECEQKLPIEYLPAWMGEAILDQIDVFDNHWTSILVDLLLTLLVGSVCARRLRVRKVRKVRVYGPRRVVW